MSRPASKSRCAPALPSAMLATVSLAICLGAAAPVGAAAAPRAVDAGERVVLNARQRHALANLYAQLTDAARKLHQAPQVAAAPVSPRVAPVVAPEPAALLRPLDRPDSLPTPPLRAALRNLPPPVLR